MTTKKSDFDRLDMSMQTFNTSILTDIVHEREDAYSAACRELQSRGFDAYGEWIGFRRAEAYWNEWLDARAELKKYAASKIER